MKNVTDRNRNGIQWTLWKQLDDLDFADDLALLSHNRQQMQSKTEKLKLNQESKLLGLNIHKGKTKVLKVNSNSNEPIKLDEEPIEEVESFTYLGSIVDK